MRGSSGTGRWHARALSSQLINIILLVTFDPFGITITPSAESPLSVPGLMGGAHTLDLLSKVILGKERETVFHAMDLRLK